jgi:hypothetical protein
MHYRAAAHRSLDGISQVAASFGDSRQELIAYTAQKPSEKHVFARACFDTLHIASDIVQCDRM